MATSLGLGVQQVTSGFNYLFDIPVSDATMVALIVVITAVALTSVLTGINVGIKRLSQFNVILALALLLAVIVLGPTGYAIRSIAAGFGDYLAKIGPLSNWIGREDTGFVRDWTTFYFAWWFAWAPFVGTFHRPDFPGAHGPRIRRLRTPDTHNPVPSVVWRVWRRRLPPAHRRGVYRGYRKRRGLEARDRTVQDA